jgi:Ni/Fe-hydrogenase subunit HybB-like protein
MSTAVARPVGGRILTPFFLFMLALWAAGTVAGLIRFTSGLGASTALSDGYPWGIWIALDVVVGTALACGGYAVALLVYIFNRGQYHPLVRPAILTSALGYSTAAVAIVFDVGRYWGLWKVPLFVHRWNLRSALLEVALCVMAYIVVLWVEVSPAILDRWREAGNDRLRRLAESVGPKLQAALPYVIALGLLLPTMHQSTLGSVWLLPVSKLHKLWLTSWLPFLFLVSCISMGYGMVVLETTFSGRAFGLPRDTRLLGAMARAIAGVSAAFAAVRIVDVLWRGQLGAAFRLDRLSLLFLLETALWLASVVMLLAPRMRDTARWQIQTAFVLVAAGTLYRLNTYLFAFNPGPGWTYFPSVVELLVTFGLVATETMAYLVIVKRFPILAGAPAPAARGRP